MTPRILINTIPLLGQKSGVGKYVGEVARGMARMEPQCAYTYYYGYRSATLLADAPSQGEASPLHVLKNLLQKHRLAKRLARKLLRLGECLRPNDQDVYFEPNFILQDNLLAAHNLVTVHDFSCFLYPDWHPRERVDYFERHFQHSMERAERIITVSHYIRREAIEIFGLPPEKIAVIHNGVDHALYHPANPATREAFRRRKGLDDGYILYVGSIEPRKNLRNLLYAYQALPLELRERHPLYLAGCDGWKNEDIHALLHALRRHVRLLGFVPEADLPLLFNAATLLAYPSWYEGFGLPVLEAMACGCPVLASEQGALREVCADAAVYVSPADNDQLRQGLRDLLLDAERRAALSRAGLLRAAAFSWDAAARKHLDAAWTCCHTA